MRYFIFFIGCLLTAINLHAQTTVITGQLVIDNEVNKDNNPSGILIRNTQTTASTQSNSEGVFTLKVSLNDELSITGADIEERTLKITETMLHKGYVRIHLNIPVIELAEVQLKNKLKKRLEDNIEISQTAGEKINNAMGINDLDFKIKLNLKHYEAQANRVIRDVGGVNMMGLASLLSGSYKKVSGPATVKSQADQVEELKQLFTEKYFVENLKIPVGKITDYITYCYVNYNFAAFISHNNYDMILNHLEEQAPVYLALLDKIE